MDPEPEPEEPGEEVPPTISITAGIPSDVMVNDYDADEGFSGSVSQSGDTFIVDGIFTNMSGQDDDVKGTTGTGYYLPIEFENGVKGMVIKRQDTGQEHIFGETGDTDTTMILVLHVDQNNPTIQLTEYADKSAADSDLDGKPFTIDCSSCSFE